PAGVDVFSESPIGGEYVVLRCATALDFIAPGRNDGARVCVAGLREAFGLAREIRRALLAPMLDHELVEALAWRLAQYGAYGAYGAHGATSPRGGIEHRHALARARYAPALARIADAFDQPLAIDELAAMTDQSPLAFLRGFTAAVGLPPHAYLVEQRLQAARRLLADGRRPLTDIALACGFSHQSHFGNAFKRAFGMTPDDYRRLLGGTFPAACQRT
ncbi:MAG: helix-turn-helix domain-containing protein, partial [Trinickia sp.]